ncbi:MAG: lytic murein transglycosylase [Deltaproteobacteria bacterium]|nr:lytic murein transglycosylase [Deltaproteobacteria bacterium]
MIRFVLIPSMVFLAAGVSVLAAPFDSLSRRLISDGFETAYIERVYSASSVQFDSKPVLTYFKIRESKLDYGQFLKPELVTRCKDYMSLHREVLSGIEKETGLPPSLLAALFMVETRLGAYTGRFQVLSVLSSLSASSDAEIMKTMYGQLEPSERERNGFDRFQQFCVRKSKWAYEELKAFLRHAAAEDIPPESIQGSLAGAFGIPQFIPSNVLRYGADGNGDGQVDLFSDSDALASAANILVGCGWKPGLNPEQRHEVLKCYNQSDVYARTVLELTRLIDEAGTPSK